MSILSKPYFHDELAAIAHLESIVWADGVVCPHCGVIDRAGKLQGKKTPLGTWKCYACRKKFTAKVGTLFEDSPVKVHKWLQAVYLMTSSKKGISAHQLHRTLEVTYKTAWFMAHRIREAMRPSDPSTLGGEGKIVEADETFVGPKKKNRHRRDKIKRGRGPAGKEMVFSLVERGGKVRSTHVPAINAHTLRPILMKQLDAASRLMTDDAKQYIQLGRHFADHQSVRHTIDEYVRGDAHTNTIEGYFSIFKRGMGGVYQHCSPKHLKRYLAEFDFRYNEREIEDNERADAVLRGISGKRLIYKTATC